MLREMLLDDDDDDTPAVVKEDTHRGATDVENRNTAPKCLPNHFIHYYVMFLAFKSTSHVILVVRAMPCALFAGTATRGFAAENHVTYIPRRSGSSLLSATAQNLFALGKLHCCCDSRTTAVANSSGSPYQSPAPRHIFPYRCVWHHQGGIRSCVLCRVSTGERQEGCKDTRCAESPTNEIQIQSNKQERSKRRTRT